MAADPFPAELREHLAASRAEGVPFDEAWDAALKRLKPRRTTALDVSGWPLGWMREVFQRAYHGHEIRSIALDPPSVSTGKRGPLGTRTPEVRCKSGDRCTAAPAKDSRFCARHRDQLAAIRESYAAGGRSWWKEDDYEDEDAEGRRAA